MDFGRAFTYAFQDPDWLKKVGIAAAVAIIPVVGQIIVLGWGLEICRRVINNDPTPLPDWTDFGAFLSKGFQGFVVGLAYALPIIVIVVCGQVFNIVIAAAASNSDSSAVSGLATVFSLCFSCFIFLFSIAAMLLVAPAMGNLAATGELGAAFRFNEVFGLLRAAIGPYLLSILCIFLAALILAPLGSLVCGIGFFVSIAYINVVSYHLYGQAYTVAKAAQAAPATLAPM